MGYFVLSHRRAGLFTETAKLASRSSVADTLGRFGKRMKMLSDNAAPDRLGRRVVVLEAEPALIEEVAARLGPHAVIEPLVLRRLHRPRPAYLRGGAPLDASTLEGHDDGFAITVTARGKPFARAPVMLHLADSFGNQTWTDLVADDGGRVRVTIPPGRRLVAVEAVPYAGSWIMVADAPASGSRIDCCPIPSADAAGRGWWHDVMGIDMAAARRGAGIKVGVIDTGCGPHPNLRHVELIGAFLDGNVEAGPAATADVSDHGTHTTGIIGARPTRAGEYAGIAPACKLFHARVFKGEAPQDGPTNADLVQAIDALSREHGCDLINISLQGNVPTELEQDAIRDAAERGTLCICAAGNDMGPISYPAGYPDCAAVSAVGQIGAAPAGSLAARRLPVEPEKVGINNLFLATFSNFAAGPGQALACCAPGVGIVSTVPDRGRRKGLYMEMDGTSMASPAACGALAVILGRNPEYKALPPDRTRATAARRLLERHARSIGLDYRYEGRGLLSV